ncbi:MAG: thioredoxin family protein, partial [Sinomicrobium sp.]|nr:thioredoxin family protein [Sinomicrobium sp.]
MKQLILLMTFGLYIYTLPQSATPITFLDMDLNAVREVAGQRGSLYFAFFTANWCAPCQWMEQRTFQDQELAQYVGQNYLAVKVDIDDLQGRVHQERYQVKLLPTILIFNAQGQLLVKIETAIAEKEFLEILKAHDLPKNRIGSIQNTITTNEDILDSPKPILRLYRPPLPAENPPGGSILPAPVEIKPAPEPDKVPAFQPTREFFAPRSERTYSIRIADYSDYDQAVRQVGQLEAGFKEPVRLIGAKDENGLQSYRIFIGMFADKTSAE